MIRTILVPLDGSEFSERALPVGIELATALNARVVLVSVAGSESAIPLKLTPEDRREISEQYADVEEEEEVLSTEPRMVERAQEQIRAVDEAEEYLASIAAKLSDTGVQIEVAAPYGPAVEGILSEIDLRSADLVVMCTHGRSGLNRLISGSVASAVLAHSPVPVLMVPPDK
ncbi:MAG TPA: universal stress protein [Anaerolineaceae bacterium]|nr:universal stress protein [Anaerolineaceae bacterium]